MTTILAHLKLRLGTEQRFAEIRRDMVTQSAGGISPLPATTAQDVPTDAPEAVKRHADTYRIARQPWWDEVGR